MHLMYVHNWLDIGCLAEICLYAVIVRKRETAVLWYIVSRTDYKLQLKTQCNRCFSLRNYLNVQESQIVTLGSIGNHNVVFHLPDRRNNRAQ